MLLAAWQKGGVSKTCNMSRNKCKPRLIPEQDKRICGGICFCQLTVVLSCVALVYLTVAIYIPSHRAFNSGFETTPVTCQTVNTTMLNNCVWASCGEWCLTKTSGFCPQIEVTVRQNGTELMLEGCSNPATISCPPVNESALDKINCNSRSVCATLTGLVNCLRGHCSNVSEIMQCRYTADGMQVDSDRDNAKLNGIFECRNSRCKKVRHPMHCDRYCDHISTVDRNVYLSYEDSVLTAKCYRAVATTESNGALDARSIPQVTVWKANRGQVLATTCRTVQWAGTILRASDCINGTIIKDSDFPKPSINFTVFWNIIRRNKTPLDPTQKFLPAQSSITIYNKSRLYINLEGCVNTLQGECKKFLQTHGNQGANNTAQSRFLCYYNKNDSFMVVARFDLAKTWRDFIIAIVIPSVLFVLSFITLCIITQSVRVGDDTKMRCQCCLGTHEGAPLNAAPILDLHHKPKPKYKLTVDSDETPVEEESMSSK